MDLRKRQVNMLLPEAEIGARFKAPEAGHGYRFPPSQTPWQEIQVPGDPL